MDWTSDELDDRPLCYAGTRDIAWNLLQCFEHCATPALQLPPSAQSVLVLACVFSSFLLFFPCFLLPIGKNAFPDQVERRRELLRGENISLAKVDDESRFCFKRAAEKFIAIYVRADHLARTGLQQS